MIPLVLPDRVGGLVGIGRVKVVEVYYLPKSLKVVRTGGREPYRPTLITIPFITLAVITVPVVVLILSILLQTQAVEDGFHLSEIILKMPPSLLTNHY